jgi:predicted nucleotidyltransferase
MERLGERLGAEWPNIAKAEADAVATRQGIAQALMGKTARVNSDDASIIVFGSLARREWTSGSDVDWTLLIDGPADPEHVRIAQGIAQTLTDSKFAKPSGTGTFGNMAFSHQIIHQIGGSDDTNRNLTQRVLLLLESSTVGDSAAYDRVCRGVLDRYLEDDPSLASSDPQTQKLPRFLLNDVVRFWRTMAVDYASKQRERGRKGWAIRNIKLRMSRKLIFVKGLLICYECILKPLAQSQIAANLERKLPPLVSHLRQSVSRTALEVLADTWLDFPNDASASRMFAAYDRFLGSLDDLQQRKHLEDLKPDDAANDELFQRMRGIGHTFQDSLNDLFFGTPALLDLTRKYGVF